MYSNYTLYTSIYGNELTEAEYTRLGYQASRFLDIQTTGIDGVKKLVEFFPTDEYDSNAVKYAECRLIHNLKAVENAEESINNANSFIEKFDGTVMRKMVSSVSSGSESISYATQGASGSAIYSAASDSAKKTALLREIISEELSGIKDCNGINLLYMGKYPCIKIQ